MVRCFLLLLALSLANGQTLDILLSGGQVVDGSGSPAQTTDIGISGDQIAFIGDAKAGNVKARRTISVSGLIVSPGFIDPHTHTFADLSGKGRSNENYLRQGVTTVVTGNDGGGPVDIGKAFRKWKQQSIGTNAALYVGQGTIRREVMGMSDAAPTPEQMQTMKRMVRSSMETGALGLSTGLFYTPASYAKTDEIVALAKIAGSYGGVYDTHIRDESSYNIGVLGAMQEAITICKQANIPLHLSHIKTQGPRVWGKSNEAIQLIRRAQAEGLKISADQYPYTGSGTALVPALVPGWAQVGGKEKMLARMSDPVERPKVIADMEKNLTIRGGANLLLITTAPDKKLIGKTLEQVASERHQPPVPTAIEIIQAGGAGIASLNIKESDIENFMKQDFVVTGSDGSEGHPRKYGTFPRKYRVYVREQKLISLPFFIQHSSAKTAEDLHLGPRGLLKKGYFADVIIFDPQTFTDKATYEHPEVFSEGVKYVIVNGQVTIDNGKLTGTLSGRPLPRVRSVQ